MPKGNCNLTPRLETRCSQTRHFENVLNFKSWIKLIYDKITYTYGVINEFNPIFETQNMANEAFKNASFGNASFGNGNEDYSCLWTICFSCTSILLQCLKFELITVELIMVPPLKSPFIGVGYTPLGLILVTLNSQHGPF